MSRSFTLFSTAYFIFFITPIGIIKRLFHYDDLGLDFSDRYDSYWIEKKSGDDSLQEHQLSKRSS